MAIGVAIVCVFAWHRSGGRNAADDARRAERLDAPEPPAAEADTRPLPPADPSPLWSVAPARRVPPPNARQPRVPVAIGLESYTIDELGMAEASALGVREETPGLIVTHVYSDSPSERAAFREGDLVVAIDGQAVSSRGGLEAILSRHAPQDAVTVDLRRAGRSQQLTVVLEALMDVLPRACDRGDAAACFAAGNRLRNGVYGVPRDSPRAAAFFERACSSGRDDACINLGRMLRRGDGVPADPSRSAVLFERACDAGIPQGCHNLGILYRDGLGVPRDPERARHLTEAACTHGDRDACSPSAEEPEY